jgi:hypothetical protein
MIRRHQGLVGLSETDNVCPKRTTAHHTEVHLSETDDSAVRAPQSTLKAVLVTSTDERCHGDKPQGSDAVELASRADGAHAAASRKSLINIKQKFGQTLYASETPWNKVDKHASPWNLYWCSAFGVAR